MSVKRTLDKEYNEEAYCPFDLNTKKVLASLSTRETSGNQDLRRCYKINTILQNCQDHLKASLGKLIKTK